MIRVRRDAGGLALALAIAVPGRVAGNVIDVPAEQPTIQAGINAAVPGDTVRIANGTYTGAANRNLRFGGRAIVVRSANGPAACIVDAQNAGRGFLFDAAETANSRLEGLTITHGIHAAAGGGLAVVGASPTIQGCILTDNRTNDGAPGSSGVPGGNGGDGAGIHVASGSPLFIRCTITNNKTGNGGAGFVSGSGPGGSPGGGGGLGAGIYIATGATATLRWCVVSGNVTGDGATGGSSVLCIPPFACQTFGENGGNGGDGGGCFVAGTLQAANCILAGNRTGAGGAAGFGVELPLPTPGRGGNGAGWQGGTAVSAFLNGTVYGNQVAAAGGSGQPAGETGGIRGVPGITNAIVWGNNSTQIAAGASVTYSDVQGGYAGTGNLAVDPQFVNAAGGNYRLQPASPCVDAGNNAAVPGFLSVDLDNHARIQDGDANQVSTVDLGAYEVSDPTDAGPPTTDGAFWLHVSGVSGDDGPIRIRYAVGGRSRAACLEIFDVAGRCVRSLGCVSAPAGEHTVAWDRRDTTGARVSRGVYWIRLRANERSATARLVLVRR